MARRITNKGGRVLGDNTAEQPRTLPDGSTVRGGVNPSQLRQSDQNPQQTSTTSVSRRNGNDTQSGDFEARLTEENMDGRDDVKLDAEAQEELRRQLENQPTDSDEPATETPATETTTGGQTTAGQGTQNTPAQQETPYWQRLYEDMLAQQQANQDAATRRQEREAETQRQMDQLAADNRAAEEQRQAEAAARLEESKNNLWESLSYTYGKKMDKSDASYDQSISKTDRGLLSKGMQRSTYGAQTLANMEEAKIAAQGDIYDALIADYHDRVTQLVKDERQFEQTERQLAENRRQFDTNMLYQQNRAAAQDEQWERQFDFNRERAAVQDTQWERQFSEGQRQFDLNLEATYAAQQTQRDVANISANASMANTQAQIAATAEQNRLQREWQTNENAANRQWQTTENEANRQLSRDQMQQNQDQFDRSQSETERHNRAQEDAANNSQNSADQNNAYNRLINLIQGGARPNAQQIADAGLTQEQADALWNKYHPTNNTPRNGDNNNSGGDGNQPPQEPGTGVEQTLTDLWRNRRNAGNQNQTTPPNRLGATPT